MSSPPTCGHAWRLAWSNPYTQPPGGLARMQLETFALSARPADIPACVEARRTELGGPGSGWACYYVHITPPPKRHTQERKARTRVSNLRRRVGKRIGPLFSETVITQIINENPAYFQGEEQRPSSAEYVARCDSADARRWAAYQQWHEAQTGETPGPLPPHRPRSAHA